MVRHYLEVAFRTFARNRSYAVVNILGLSLGIACALVIFLYVYDEVTYDRNHTQYHQIYRLNGGYVDPNHGQFTNYACIGSPLGALISKEFPEIEQVVRIRKMNGFTFVKPGTREEIDETIYAADSNLFKVFTYPFLQGNPDNALYDIDAIVISRKAAMKYFSRTDVVGETLPMYFGQKLVDFKVTGVFEDYPTNTHLKTDFIVTMEKHHPRPEWYQYGYHTYLKLGKHADAAALDEKVRHISRKFIATEEDEIGYKQIHSLTALKDIHLRSNLRAEMETNGKASYVYLFLVIGIFIIVIACINFMNLATARSAKRAKEIGVRKVVGAMRSQLIRQFLGEACMMTVAAVLIAVVAVAAFLPYVNNFTDKTLSIAGNNFFWMILFAITCFVTILAGGYPSFFLSAFRPAETLKGNFTGSSKGKYLRKGLVVFQFGISIVLIAGTLIINRHLQFLRSKDLGFEKDKVMFINVRAYLPDQVRALKTEFDKIAALSHVTLSYVIPGKRLPNNVVAKGWSEDAPQIDLRFNLVDFDFIDTYNLKMIAGRPFSPDVVTDQKEAFIVNESGAHALGFRDATHAIGQELLWNDFKGRVIGVLKDFHFMGPNNEIEPFFMVMNNGGGAFLSFKVNSQDLPETIRHLEATFKRVLPTRTFDYNFLDEDFDRQFHAEDRFMVIFTAFSSIAIFIACLGLYGLAMFMAEQRRKEVGIRKVLGASESNIVLLLTSDFVRLVAIAFCLALPIAWWSMEQWLSTFPFREPLSATVFLITAAAVLVITLITVSYQALLAAVANPVNTLRTE